MVICTFHRLQVVVAVSDCEDKFSRWHESSTYKALFDTYGDSPYNGLGSGGML
jgi:hypothetical protein